MTNLKSLRLLGRRRLRRGARSHLVIFIKRCVGRWNLFGGLWTRLNLGDLASTLATTGSQEQARQDTERQECELSHAILLMVRVVVES